MWRSCTEWRSWSRKRGRLSTGRVDPRGENLVRWDPQARATLSPAASGDLLVYGATGGNLEVQWFGLPGPNAMVDRLARKQGPLSTSGRLFTLANDRIIAQDAYNGTIIWSAEMPGLLRNNIPRNTGNACADDEHLFVAMRDRCWRFNAATGARFELAVGKRSRTGAYLCRSAYRSGVNPCVGSIVFGFRPLVRPR